MKYFFDTEFIEGTQKTWFGKTKPTIDLISIGMVGEDDRTYYAVSKDFNLKEAWNRFDLNYGSGDQRNLPPTKVYWIRENVLKPIYKELRFKELNEIYGDVEDIETFYDPSLYFKEFKRLINKYGKSNKEIAQDIRDFVAYNNYSSTTVFKDHFEYAYIEKPEFYAYYCNYDWVAFCWLFGKMIELPKGFPMYCRDLKQMVDEKIYHLAKLANTDFENTLKALKNNSNYPKQFNAHNALDDAMWNKSLYEFLTK